MLANKFNLGKRPASVLALSSFLDSEVTALTRVAGAKFAVSKQPAHISWTAAQ